MHRRSHHSSRPGLRRTGFTLVELLVVITIIAILAALTLRVAFGMINSGREAGTKSTIQKIHRILDARLQAFQRRYGGNDPTSLLRLKNTSEWQIAGDKNRYSVNSNSVSNPVSDAQRRIITRKLLYAKWFPQTGAEAKRNSNLYPGIKKVLDANPSNTDPNLLISNAEVLYAVLMDSQSLGESTTGIVEFLASEFGDSDLDELPEFKDAWGESIRFYRWPTRLFRSDEDGDGFADDPPSTKYAGRLTSQGFRLEDLKRDPMDPLAQCSTVTDPSNTTFENLFHTSFTFHAPLIISGGTDKDFGLHDPSNTVEFGHLGELSDKGSTDPAVLNYRGDALSDNISSMNIRAGGN